MNRIQELTKDCPRDDCLIYDSMGGTSTCMGWQPSYDKQGNRTDRGDPNIHTTSSRCVTCGAEWVFRIQYGETTTTRVEPNSSTK